MKVTAIVSDLDDTLLNKQAKLTEATVATLRRCRERGIRVILASGRALHSMKATVEALDVGEPYISCNGAQLVDENHQPIETLGLPIELAKTLLAFINERGVYCQVYRGEHFYYAQECQYAVDYQRSSGITGVEVGDLDAFLDFETPKMLCTAPPEVIRKLYAELRERFGGQVAVTVSKPYFCELSPPEATKGQALERLAGRIGLDLATTMAFGDSLNDLDMLTRVGYGVAVGNARDEVKRAVSYVADDHDRDGVARFIQQHVLQEGKA